MVITWYGQSCFKIQSGELVIAIDPFDKAIGLTPPRFRADAVLVTHNHYDHSNSASIAGEPFLITGPGEYEVKDVYIKGIPSYHDRSEGKERGTNTIYTIALEGLRVAHLGDFGEGALRDETVEAIGDADIALVPVGGSYTIDAEEAARVVKQIEPKAVIPMHYKITGLKVNLAGVEQFLKEMGVRNGEPQEKLTLKKKDLEGKEKTDVITLRAVAS